jgi:hypothetical protein
MSERRAAGKLPGHWPRTGRVQHRWVKLTLIPKFYTHTEVGADQVNQGLRHRCARRKWGYYCRLAANFARARHHDYHLPMAIISHLARLRPGFSILYVSKHCSCIGAITQHHCRVWPSPWRPALPWRWASPWAWASPRAERTAPAEASTPVGASPQKRRELWWPPQKN